MANASEETAAADLAASTATGAETEMPAAPEAVGDGAAAASPPEALAACEAGATVAAEAVAPATVSPPAAGPPEAVAAGDAGAAMEDEAAEGAAVSPPEEAAPGQAPSTGSKQLSELVRKGSADAVREHASSSSVEEMQSWQNDAGQNLLFLAVQRRGACEAGAEEISRFLIGKGVPFDVPDKRRQTPLFFAVAAGGRPLASLLLEKRARVDFPDRIAQTPLFYAARYGHLDCVELLLEGNASASNRDVNYQAPLFYATRFGHPMCATALLKAPTAAPAGALDSRGQTALFGAKDLENCRRLLEGRCDPNIRDLYGQSVLFYAAKAGDLEVAKLLLGWQAEVNVKDRNRDTPLFYAAQQGHKATCQYLVESSAADVLCPNKVGLTAAKVAEQKGHQELAALLVSWSKSKPPTRGRRRPGAAIAACPLPVAAQEGTGGRQQKRRLTAKPADKVGPATLPTEAQNVDADGESRQKYYIAFTDPSDPTGEQNIPFGTEEYRAALQRLCESCPALSLKMWRADAPLTRGPSAQ